MDLDHFILDPCLESVEREDQEPTVQSSSNSATSSNEPEVDANEDSYGKSLEREESEKLLEREESEKLLEREESEKSLEREESQESNPIEELTIHTKLTKKLLDQLIPYQEEDDDYFFDPIFHFHSCPSTYSSLHRKSDQEGKNRVKQTTITPLDLIDTTLPSIGNHTTHHTNYLLDTNSTSFSSLFIDTYTCEDNHHNLTGSLIDSSFDSSMDNLDPMATLYAFNASSGNNNSPPSCNDNTTPPLPLPPPCPLPSPCPLPPPCPLPSPCPLPPPCPLPSPCPDEQSGVRPNPQQSLGNNTNDVLTHSSPTLNNDSSLCLRRSSTSPSVSCPSISCPSASCPSVSCPSASCPSVSCPSISCPSAVPRCSDSAQSDGANTGSVDHVRDIHPYQHTGSSSTGYYHFYDNHCPGNGHYHQYHSYPTHSYHEHNWPMSPSMNGPPPPQSLVEGRIVNHCSTPVSPIQSSTIQFPTGNGSMSVNLSMNMSFTASSSVASSASNAAVEPRTDRTSFGQTLQPVQQQHQQILWTPTPSQASCTTEYNYPTSGLLHSPTSHAYHSEYHQPMPPSNGQVYHQLSSRVIQGDHVRQPDGGYPAGPTARVLLPPIEKEFAGISTFHRHRSSPSSTSVETSGMSGSNSEIPSTGPMVHTRSQTRYSHSYHAQYHQPRGLYNSGRGQQQRHSHQRRSTSSSSFSRSSDLDDSPPDTLATLDTLASGGSNSTVHLPSHANLNLPSGLRSRSGMKTDSQQGGILLSSTVTSASSHHGQVDDIPVIVGRPGGHLLVQLDRGSRRMRKGFQEDEKEDDEEASAERGGRSDSRDCVGMETRRSGEVRSPGSLLDHHNLTDPSVSLDSGQYGAGGPNLCGICGKSYARPSTLKTHLRTHSGERPYRCDMCYKSFSQAANLTAHLRTHSGEKPFTCQICGRRFSQSSSVTTHMRTHSGERPYRCYMCRKAFSDSSTLTKHLRIHSGEKPYQCKLCHLKFSQSGNLNRHMRIHSVGQT